MSSDLKKVEEYKTSAELSAWRFLDDFFKKVNPDNKDHDKARVAIMTISMKMKSESIELLERKLSKELNPGGK